MGGPMAAQLGEFCRANGNELQVWNRTPGRDVALVANGARTATGPAELVAASEVVVVMLPDLPQLADLTGGPVRLLSGVVRPTVLVICSSISPGAARSYAAWAAELTDGLVQVVDAPVSGGTEGAAAGTLAIMAGGAESAIAAAWPALTAMGTTVWHLGPLGSGSLAKACNQMVVAATVVALSEACTLAESAGIEVGALLDVLSGGFAASRVLEVKAANLVSKQYPPTGKAIYMVKDLGFVRAEAELTGTPTDQALLSLELFTAVAREGLGDQDMSVVHQLIRRRAGL